MPRPSLYEILYGNFAGGLALNQVGEEEQVILSVLDNMQRILNTRAGSLKHLPDYGLPDMTTILQGMPGNPFRSADNATDRTPPGIQPAAQCAAAAATEGTFPR